MAPAPVSGPAQGANSSAFTKQEIQDRVDTFVAGASSGEDFDECPTCFRLMVREIIGTPKLLRVAQRSWPGFWEACLHYIVLLATANIPRLRNELRECQLECTMRDKLHKIKDQGSLRDPVDILLDGLFTAIYNVLRMGRNPLLLANNRPAPMHFLTRHSYWPLAKEDLFPIDIEGTLDALVFWCCVPFSELPCSVLILYLILVRPVVIDALLEAPRRERVVWSLLQALTPSSTVPWPAACPAPFSPPPGLAMSYRLRGESKMVEMALSFLAMLRTSPYARRDDPARLLAGFEREFARALRNPPANNWVLFPKHLRIIDDYRCMLSKRDMSLCTHADLTPLAVMQNYIGRSMESVWCANPGCMEHELGALGEEPVRFARCGRCKAVRYCSRECQRAHWKSGPMGHKDVCGVLCAVRGDRRKMAVGKPAFLLSCLQLSQDKSTLLTEATKASTVLPYYRHLQE